MLKQFLMFWCEDEATAQRYIDNDWWVEMPVSKLDEVLRKFMSAQQSVQRTAGNVCPHCGFETISEFDVCPRCLKPAAANASR